MTPEERKDMEEIAATLRKILNRGRRVNWAATVFLVIGSAVAVLSAVIARDWFLVALVVYLSVMGFYVTPRGRMSAMRVGWAWAWNRATILMIRAEAPPELMEEMRMAGSLVPNQKTMRAEQQMLLRDIETALATDTTEEQT